MAAGTLYLVATPIGNLEDITLRALRVLEDVDLIACEDTRHTAGLLSRFGIKTPRESYHEHNEKERSRRILELLRSGKNVALVSDAGMPLVSDPGFVLVSACRSEGIPVVPLPGASAVTAAIAGSGLPAREFHFAGFLPSRSAARRRELRRLAPIESALIFYEAPHRILSSLEDMVSVYGARRACLARELTKVHEEWISGTLDEILGELRGRGKIQGEMTLVVAPGEASQERPVWPDSIEEHVEQEMKRTGAARKEALKAVARQRGISRREAYQQLLKSR